MEEPRLDPETEKKWTMEDFEELSRLQLENDAYKEVTKSIMNRIMVITHELQTIALQLASANNDPTKLFGNK